MLSLTIGIFPNMHRCGQYYEFKVLHGTIDKVQKSMLPVCRALQFSPAQADQVLTERLVRELAPV